MVGGRVFEGGLRMLHPEPGSDNALEIASMRLELAVTKANLKSVLDLAATLIASILDDRIEWQPSCCSPPPKDGQLIAGRWGATGLDMVAQWSQENRVWESVLDHTPINADDPTLWAPIHVANPGGPVRVSDL